MFNPKAKLLATSIALLFLQISVYANTDNVISVSQLKKIYVDMDMESALKILGKPNNDSCSGVYCAEWKLTDGKVLYIHGGSYVDTIMLKVPNEHSK